MGSKKIDKTIPRYWEDGDTFAIKIENTKTKYDGKYIILNKYTNSKWEIDSRYKYFHVKITKNHEIPSMSELNELEFVKILFRHYIERYYPREDVLTWKECLEKTKDEVVYPDEYNYLYSYTIRLRVSRKDDYSDFIYIGNSKIEGPTDEYNPRGKDGYCFLVFKDTLVKNILEAYEDYNLKKSIVYTDEQRRIIEENVLKNLTIYYKATTWLSEYRKHHKDHNSREKHEEIIKDTITYVGGEESNEKR